MMLRYFLRVWAMTALCAGALAAGADEPAIPVGVAQADITPDYPVRLSGFGFRRAESEGVTLPVWAKALAFGDEAQGPAILITVDNLCVPEEITAEVARRLRDRVGARRERLTITATHTHTAPMLNNVCPTLFGEPIPPEHQRNIDRYTREFTDALERVAVAACESIAPARVSWGKGSAGFAANRRTKGGPVDHDLPVLAVTDLEGKTRALYFSYACHCVTLSDNKISGDWAGFAQKRVREHFPGAIALASVGCGADANPSSGVTGANSAVCAQQGDEIAREVQRLVAAGLKPIRSKPETRYARLDLALDKPRPREEWEARAKRQDAIGHQARVTLEKLGRGDALPEKINYPIQTWLFGEDLAIVFLPGETVVDYALRLKREYDRNRLWVNGYANNGRCYIPSERVLKEGGYEGGDAMIYYDFPQRFAPGLEDKIIGTVARQLPAGFQAPPGTEGTRPLSADEALRSFRIGPGLRVELAAAEPLVQDPVAIDWGADGRLWVCEMHDYPSGLDRNWEPGGRVKFLTDDNGDGRYDRATVFLEPLPFPTGVTAWGRGVLVCAAPDILYAEDTDGDGRADKVEKLFTGFHTDNYQARVNSLSLGLDNWIHGANGLLGGKIQPLANPLFPAAGGPVDIRNRDFRIDPISGAFETVSGLTQQGRARDDWGNWFGCDNSRLLLHYPLPDAYLRRNPQFVAPAPVHELTARPDGNRVYPISPLQERFNDPDQANRATSATGVGIYRDTVLGDGYYGNAFTCEPVHNLVHREIVRGGLTFQSGRAGGETNSEFLSSTDNWFRPVQARPGPDGALYIVDMYRFLIEHPRWVPAPRLAQIDVRAGADRGRIFRVVPVDWTARPIRDLTRLSGADLAGALEAPNGIERDRVHTELLARREKSAAPRLGELAAKAGLPQVRVQALAALAGLAAPEPAQILTALRDPAPEVRIQGLRLAEPWLATNRPASDVILEAVLALAADPSEIVVRQLAFTLGESAAPQAGMALAEISRRRLANSELRVAVLSSAARHCGEILTAVLASDPGAPGRAEWISPLVATAANSRDAAVVRQAVRASLPAVGTEPGEAQLNALAILADKLERRDGAAAELDSATRQRLDAAIAAAAKIAADPGASEGMRRAALPLAAQDRSEGALKLAAQLAAESSPALRRAAIATLRRWRSISVANEVLGHWPHASPAARSELVSLLLEREEWTLALLEAAEHGQPRPQEFALADRQRLARSDSARVRDLAARVLPAKNAGARAEVLERYQEVLALPGDAGRGSAVFAKNCAACHFLNGLGHATGPDLAALRGRDGGFWIQNILDPNAIVEPRFVTYEIELRDGRSLSGLIKDESGSSLTIAAANGISETVLRPDIEEIRASALSLMPEGLEQAIASAEMADLLAFVRGGRTRKTMAGNEPQPAAPGQDGVIELAAARAEIFGEAITFEPGFRNLGMWHGAQDEAAWTVRIDTPGSHDIYLDYACAAGSAGNRFVLEIGGQALTGTVADTGQDWSHYRQIRAGSVQLPAGTHRAVFRPDGPIRGALIDLRTIVLAPAGTNPQWPTAAPAKHDDLLRDAPSIAGFILDPSSSDAARNAVIQSNPQFAGALIGELARGLAPGKEEYARIPWIWRIAIACGKRNEAGQIAAVLETALPRAGEPLRDWQAVALGGGIVNGLSQRGLWPAVRIREIAGAEGDLKNRWRRALELSSDMAEKSDVPAGTRYDALRLIALEGWEKRGPQLLRYLAPGGNPELQMGAVSGLADIDHPKAAEALLGALGHLEGGNRELAIGGLLRGEPRQALLLAAVKSGRVTDPGLRARLGD